jgi:CheY-like chemotaxis protein/two-component sensor histidine kinase
MELRRQRVALADVIAHAVETAEPVIRQAGHELTVELPRDPVHLDADTTRLAQVFSNLLNNSARYTPAPGRIRLHARILPDAVAVAVEDNGLGIPQAALPGIFEMFSQVDRGPSPQAGRTHASGGLGIGLALVKGLVEMHAGTVEVQSTEGEGSVFTVRLPTVTPEPASVGPPPISREVPAKRRVLVVDDNLDSAESMHALLTMMGNAVESAHDGHAAVAAAENFRPDIILMDIGLPGLSGLEATRQIRSHPWGVAPVIIALTGWGQDSDRQESRDAGCNAHLVKPVDFAQLEALLARLSPASDAASRHAPE